METGWFGYGKKRFLFPRKAFWRTQIHHISTRDLCERGRKILPSNSLELVFTEERFFRVWKMESSETTWHIFKSNTNLHFLRSNGTRQVTGVWGRAEQFFLCINFSQTHSGIFFFLPCLSSILNFNSIIFLSLFRDVWSRIIARNIFLFTFSAVFSRKIHSMIMQSSISLRSLSFF